MASKELRAMVALIRDQKGVASEGLSVAARRAGFDAMQAALPMPDDIRVESVDMDGLGGCWFDAPGARDDTYIIYYHGGGYIMGSIDTHKTLMGRLSRVCSARVLGVEYRLAPEHVYPAAVEDGVQAYKWLIEQGADPARIVLAGDSAGGGLTIATLLALRNQSARLPAGAVVFSPWIDLTASGESVTTRAQADPGIEPGVLIEIAQTYYGNADPKDPLVSPVFADLTGLPPLLIQVGDAEVLLSDAVRLADNAHSAGVKALYQVWDEAFHVFQATPGLPEAEEALLKVGTFYRDLVR